MKRSEALHACDSLLIVLCYFFFLCCSESQARGSEQTQEAASRPKPQFIAPPPPDSPPPPLSPRPLASPPLVVDSCIQVHVSSRSGRIGKHSLPPSPGHASSAKPRLSSAHEPPCSCKLTATDIDTSSSSSHTSQQTCTEYCWRATAQHLIQSDSKDTHPLDLYPCPMPCSSEIENSYSIQDQGKASFVNPYLPKPRLKGLLDEDPLPDFDDAFDYVAHHEIIDLDKAYNDESFA